MIADKMREIKAYIEEQIKYYDGKLKTNAETAVDTSWVDNCYEAKLTAYKDVYDKLFKNI